MVLDCTLPLLGIGAVTPIAPIVLFFPLQARVHLIFQKEAKTNTVTPLIPDFSRLSTELVGHFPQAVFHQKSLIDTVSAFWGMPGVS